MRSLVIEVRPRPPDPRAAHLAAAARALGAPGVTGIGRYQLYFVTGDLDAGQAERLVAEVLTHPLLEDARIRPESGAALEAPRTGAPRVVETALHAGVTDALATAVLRAAALLQLPVASVSTGAGYEIHGAITDGEVGLLTRRLLSNPVIEWSSPGRIRPPAATAPAPAAPERIELAGLGSNDLLLLSQERGLALDLEEMRAVQRFFAAEHRPATDAELETIAQTWSEHCAHKTFRAEIVYPDGRRRPPLLHQLRDTTERVAAPWVRSAFVDNAGIVAFDDRLDLAIKAETHNHPSAVEPFGGANTGVGGVIRDVLGVSARPVALTDVLCFGPPDLPADALPDGVLHPRRVRDGVIAGVADYGNKIGVPTVAGAIVHDPGYTANPLVFCGCVGVLPSGSHPRQPRPGDRVVVIGGRTGRDGIRGATFSSMTMDASTGEVAGASVQIGDPVVEKGLIDVVVAARDLGLYHAITDCGAGGLSSAVGEMAADLGADVYLGRVPRKYPGLAAWEVWLSEAQERMVLAVPAGRVAELASRCEEAEVEWADIGAFRDDGRLRVSQGESGGDGPLVVDLPGAFLHGGCPRRTLPARAPKPPRDAPAPSLAGLDVRGALLGLLRHPNLRSNADVVRGYDHEVLGGTTGRPYAGAADDGPADAAVVRPLGASGPGAFAVGIGLSPRHGVLDPERMGALAVDEAVRNVVAAGADPDRVALLDNFSWGDPRRPETLGALAAAVDGCCAAALAHRAPFVSGKDSLNNEFRAADGTRRAIPGTLVVTALGIVPDGGGRVSADLKQPTSAVVLTGTTTDELGGGALLGLLGLEGGHVPAFDPTAPERYRRLHAAMRAGAARAAHDLADGGLAVAAAEMCIAGRLGMTITLPAGLDPVVALFSESTGRHLLEVDRREVHPLEVAPDGTALGAVVGEVTANPELVVRAADGAEVLRVHVADLVEAFAGHVPGVAPEHSTPAPDTAAGGERAAPAPPLVTRRPRTLVLSAFGTNRDHEAAAAIEAAGGEPVIVPWSRLRDKPGLLHGFGLAVIAGGFTYGDALGAGALLGLELRRLLLDDLRAFIAAGKPVLGICNGFQALVRCGLLPGALAPNDHGRFECRWVTLLPASVRCVWTAGLAEPIECPVAHGEGRYVAPPDVLAGLVGADRVGLRYSASTYPHNPNGSIDDIAGVCDETGLVLGLMPHPEDHLVPASHPRATRGRSGGGLGVALFRQGVAHGRA